jgi:hypothetical protein
MFPVPKILREASLTEIIDQAPMPAELYFSNKYPSVDSPETLLEWDVLHGDPGMAPITDRGVQAPTFKGGGVSTMYARGALINEKIKTTEEDLNRVLSTDPKRKAAAERVILERVEDLLYRNRLRREWLAAQIFFNSGVISYTGKNGVTFSIDYQIPTSHQEALTGNYVWGTGSTRVPLQDSDDMRKRVEQDCGAPVTAVFINSTTLNTRIRNDTAIQALLAQSAHRISSNLFADPLGAAREYFGNLPLQVYDILMPYSTRITAIGSTTSLTLDDANPITVGSELTLCRVDEDNVEQEELVTVSAVSGNTVTVSTISGTFVAGRDLVQASIPFIPDDRLVYVAEKVKGRDICSWINSPVGMGQTRYGLQTKSWAENDPDVVFTRAQNMGLWALMNTKAIGVLDVA